MKGRDFIDKDVFALNEKIGKIKDIDVDPSEWKIITKTRTELQVWYFAYWKYA